MSIPVKTKWILKEQPILVDFLEHELKLSTTISWNFLVITHKFDNYYSILTDLTSLYRAIMFMPCHIMLYHMKCNAWGAELYIRCNSSWKIAYSYAWLVKEWLYAIETNHWESYLGDIKGWMEALFVITKTKYLGMIIPMAMGSSHWRYRYRAAIQYSIEYVMGPMSAPEYMYNC